MGEKLRLQTIKPLQSIVFNRIAKNDCKLLTDLFAYLLTETLQELPKYLSGYHHCTREKVVELAALILRAGCRNDKPVNIHLLPQILPDLVPKDFLKTVSAQEWKRVSNINLVIVIATIFLY